MKRFHLEPCGGGDAMLRNGDVFRDIRIRCFRSGPSRIDYTAMTTPKKSESILAQKIAALKLNAANIKQEVEAARARVHAAKESLKQARAGLKEAKVQAKQARKALKAEKRSAKKSSKKTKPKK